MICLVQVPAGNISLPSKGGKMPGMSAHARIGYQSGCTTHTRLMYRMVNIFDLSFSMNLFEVLQLSWIAKYLTRGYPQQPTNRNILDVM